MLGIAALVSCRQENGSTGDFNLEKELQTWKKELIASKQLGNSCKNRNSAWQKANPGQMDGWPTDESTIAHALADFDKDGKMDLLLYFKACNCNGHNGSVPTFAQIVYGNGKHTNQLMTEIQQAVLKEYNTMRTTDSTLLPILDTYIENTTTISYDEKKGINGSLFLYTAEDPHCCPSYTVNYTYNVSGKHMKLDILKNPEI